MVKFNLAEGVPLICYYYLTVGFYIWGFVSSAILGLASPKSNELPLLNLSPAVLKSLEVDKAEELKLRKYLRLGSKLNLVQLRNEISQFGSSPKLGFKWAWGADRRLAFYALLPEILESKIQSKFLDLFYETLITRDLYLVGDIDKADVSLIDYKSKALTAIEILALLRAESCLSSEQRKKYSEFLNKSLESLCLALDIAFKDSHEVTAHAFLINFLDVYSKELKVDSKEKKTIDNFLKLVTSAGEFYKLCESARGNIAGDSMLNEFDKTKVDFSGDGGKFNDSLHLQLINRDRVHINGLSKIFKPTSQGGCLENDAWQNIPIALAKAVDDKFSNTGEADFCFIVPRLDGAMMLDHFIKNRTLFSDIIRKYNFDNITVDSEYTQIAFRDLYRFLRVHIDSDLSFDNFMNIIAKEFLGNTNNDDFYTFLMNRFNVDFQRLEHDHQVVRFGGFGEYDNEKLEDSERRSFIAFVNELKQLQIENPQLRIFLRETDELPGSKSFKICDNDHGHANSAFKLLLFPIEPPISYLNEHHLWGYSFVEACKQMDLCSEKGEKWYEKGEVSCFLDTHNLDFQEFLRALPPNFTVDLKNIDDFYDGIWFNVIKDSDDGEGVDESLMKAPDMVLN